MKLKWYGHSCFSMTFDNGATVVTDPFDDTVGYPLCRAHADVALVSHDHFDHNHVQSLLDDPLVVTDGAPRDVRGLKIRGLDCFHDDAQGAARGKNIAFIVEGDGLRVAHLGDIGHMPSPEMCEALRGLDILLVPIGGTFTITTPEAVELIRRVEPHTAIAMHFKTVLCGFAITDEQDFVQLTGAKYLPNEIHVDAQSLASLPPAAVMLCPSAR